MSCCQYIMFPISICQNQELKYLSMSYGLFGPYRTQQVYQRQKKAEMCMVGKAEVAKGTYDCWATGTYACWATGTF